LGDEVELRRLAFARKQLPPRGIESEPSACRLFFTWRAANPAVVLPSTKRARASAARTVSTSSAERTLPITICISVREPIERSCA
jgi:hypothetical protein